MFRAEKQSGDGGGEKKGSLEGIVRINALVRPLKTDNERLIAVLALSG